MSTIHDLRNALEREAATVHDSPAAARVAAVRGRARAVRRRRTALGAVAALLVLGGMSTTALLPDDSSPDPADDRLLGDLLAPGTMSALGWDYEFDGGDYDESRRVTIDVEPSDVPVLVSWGTDGRDSVRVSTDGRERHASDAPDFGDHVLLPTGFAGRVQVTSQQPGVAVATYTLDESVAPPGVGEGPGAFRADVAGRRLLGAVYGEVGEASVEVDVRLPRRGLVWLATVCEGVPRGYDVHVSQSGVAGDVVFGSCQGPEFDPGGSAGMGIPVLGADGEPATFRMWLSRAEPVEDGEAGDIRLGLGIYAEEGGTVDLAGSRVPRLVESSGHVWELAQWSEDDVRPTLDLRGPGPWLATLAVAGPDEAQYRLLADGEPVSSRYVTDGGSVGEIYLPEGTHPALSLDLVRDGSSLRAAGIAVYRLADR